MNEDETTRVDEFRQFKREIRGSARYMIVGLDIAKRKHHAFFGDANGRTLLKGLTVENSAAGFAHLLTAVHFYMDRERFDRVVFGLEPTSAYQFPVRYPFASRTRAVASGSFQYPSMTFGPLATNSPCSPSSASRPWGSSTLSCTPRTGLPMESIFRLKSSGSKYFLHLCTAYHRFGAGPEVQKFGIIVTEIERFILQLKNSLLFFACKCRQFTAFYILD